jgi:hypothetical protein
LTQVSEADSTRGESRTKLAALQKAVAQWLVDPSARCVDGFVLFLCSVC